MQPAFNWDSFETVILQSLTSSLSSLKREFLDELRSLLDCCSYDVAIANFAQEIRTEVSEIISSAHSLQPFEFPPKDLSEPFGTLRLPEVSGVRESKSEPINLQPIRKMFVETSSGMLDELVNERAEMNCIRCCVQDSAEPDQESISYTRFNVEALDVQQRIAKELLDARFQRLASERAVVHGQQNSELDSISKPNGSSSEKLIAELRALVHRNRSPGIVAKTQALTDLAKELEMAARFLSEKLLSASETPPHAQERSLSCTEIDIPHDNDLLATVQARLKALRHRREEAEKEIAHLSTI
jgi:hypothetical protein